MFKLLDNHATEINFENSANSNSTVTSQNFRTTISQNEENLTYQ